MRPYVLLHKAVGQTPLEIIESYKAANPELENAPLAYAGRLDPMASGKLLILIGDECKVQEKYHQLDKEYEFEVLLGTSSDSGDVLGILNWNNTNTPLYNKKTFVDLENKLTGPIELPYPIFSSKTVKGKPLHTWALENRLNEIEIPVSKTKIYSLKCLSIEILSAEEIYILAQEKIESIPKVEDVRKAIGNDFRRDDVRLSWRVWLEHHKGHNIQVVRFVCVCSSGTYMRSLAEAIGTQLGVPGLAFSIHRTIIGKYTSLPFGFGFWKKKF